MERAARRIEWRYGVLWVTVNGVAWAIGIGLPDVIGGSEGTARWVPGLAGAFVVGAAQWWVLSRRFPHSPWWLVGYGLAWLVALVVGAYVGFLVPDPVWVGAIFGAIAGTMQWLVLRRDVRRSMVWVPTMIAGAIGGCIAGVDVGTSAYDFVSLTAAWVIGGGVAGTTLGLISAIVLLYFVAQTCKPVAPTAS